MEISPVTTPSRSEPSTATRGDRASQGKTTAQSMPPAVVQRLLDALQQKLYVLNCVISVANSMGPSLEDGWRSVASCLLQAEPILQNFARFMGQHQHHEAVNKITLQDVMRNADHVRDALHLLFINNALLPDGVALEGLLKSFVLEICERSPSSYMPSLRTISECCSLALLAAAVCRRRVSLSWLWQLWCDVKQLYLHLFDPVNILKLVSACGESDRMKEVVAVALERMVEDIAVVTAHFCQRFSCGKSSKTTGERERENSPLLRLSSGPYATTALVVRLTHLASSSSLSIPTQQDTSPTGPSTHNNAEEKKNLEEEEEEEEKRQRQLLASTIELLDRIYRHLQQHQQEPQRQEDQETSIDNSTSEAVVTVTHTASLVLLREVLKLVQGFGEELRGEAWKHLLHLLRHTAMPSSTKWTLSTTSPTAGVNNAKQNIGIAFRALETIQHSCITSLDDEGLRQLIRCGGAFMTHSLPGSEQRLNINLSAGQLLWSIADYVALREKGGDKTDDLWCTLLMQLYDSCLDVRPEVRQSALKTLFSLIHTYGGCLSADCWRCILLAVLLPLIDVVMQATNTCAIVAETSTICAGSCSRLHTTISHNLRRGLLDLDSTFVGESTQSLQGGYANEEEQAVAQLLAHLDKHPAFFEDMRVTIMDGICRAIATHYRAIYTVFVLQVADLQQRMDAEALLHEVLSLFIEMCGMARYVARTTSGESAALSAVRALHMLMSAADVAVLAESEVESAWLAVERLLRRDEEGAHAGRKQCTAAVVVAIVTSLGDVVGTRRTKNVHETNEEEADTSRLLASATASSATARSSVLMGQLRSIFSAPQPAVSHGVRPTHDYFPDYLRVIEESLRSPAVTDSYYFPGKVQTAAIDMWKTLWPLLGDHERDSVVNLALRQFPGRHAVHHFVTQDISPPSNEEGAVTDEATPTSTATTTTSTAATPLSCPQKRLTSLAESLPPGAHPNFLLALMAFFRHVADKEGGGEKEEKQQQRRQKFLFSATPDVVRALGTLLLLEYASPELLATSGAGLPFHISPDFFDKTEECLKFFVVNVLLGGASSFLEGPTESVPTTASDAPTSLSSVHREGLRSFTMTFSSLVSLAITKVRTTEEKSRGVGVTSEVPKHTLQALQRLERFVLLLGDVISHLACGFGDVSAATELLSVVVLPSSVGSLPFAGVAKRSLDLLHRWSLASSPLSRENGMSTSEAETVSGTTVSSLRPSDNELSSRLKSVARASMSARNRAVLREFLSNTANDEARQMARTTLHTIALLYPPHLDSRSPSGASTEREKKTASSENKDNSNSSNDDDDKCVEELRRTLPELARLVEHTGDDAEFCFLVSKAMLGICAALGFCSSS